MKSLCTSIKISGPQLVLMVMLNLMGVLQNHRPPTSHRQVLHRPTDKRSTDRPTSAPPTNDHRLTSRSSTDPLITESPTLLQLTTNPLIHHNRVTIGSILSIINFNYHSEWALFIIEFVKLFIKRLVKKNLDKLKFLLIIPFGN